MTHVPNTMPVVAALPVADAQTVTLDTHGSWRVEHESDGHDRCGPKGVTRELDYRVKVSGAPALLDDQGFLIDWQDIRRYFIQKFTRLGHFPSCEQIAVHAVRDIATDMLKGRCSAVEVTIGFHGGAAELTAKWEAPPGWWQYAEEQARIAGLTQGHRSL